MNLNVSVGWVGVWSESAVVTRGRCTNLGPGQRVRKGAVIEANSGDTAVQGVRRMNKLIAREKRVRATTLLEKTGRFELFEFSAS